MFKLDGTRRFETDGQTSQVKQKLVIKTDSLINKPIPNHVRNVLAVKPLKKSTDIYMPFENIDTIFIELRGLERLGTEIKQISSALCTTILKTITQDLLIELNKSENEKCYEING